MGEVRQLLPRREQDHRLVERARSGDASAERAIFREHAPFVARVVAGVLGSTVDVADVVQDTFFTAFQKLESVDDPGALRAWLTGIALNKAANARRARRRRWWLVLFEPEVLPETSAEGASPEHRELLAATDAVLRRMPDDLRAVFVLRVIEEMELQEVASATGVSLATAKRRVSSARAAFAELAARDPVLSGKLSEGA